jgi:hypothetical protein
MRQPTPTAGDSASRAASALDEYRQATEQAKVTAAVTMEQQRSHKDSFDRDGRIA